MCQRVRVGPYRVLCGLLQFFRFASAQSIWFRHAGPLSCTQFSCLVIRNAGKAATGYWVLGPTYFCECVCGQSVKWAPSFDADCFCVRVLLLLAKGNAHNDQQCASTVWWSSSSSSFSVVRCAATDPSGD